MLRNAEELVLRGLFVSNVPGINKAIPKWNFSPAHALVMSALAFFFIFSAVGQNMDYPVGPGDTLYISIWGQESLSGPVSVGPDGTIILPPPIGSVYVNQLTAGEIAELLTKELEEYVKQPVVMVSIREFQGFIAHILGQVAVPGFYRIPEGTSVQELITQARGLTELADPTSILLIRKEDEKIEKIEIDFSRFLRYSEMESNPVLKANDVVLVSRIDMKERIQRLVTVIGQVGSPGTYELETPMPLLDVLTMAGSVLNGADLRSVFILSRSGEGAEAFRQVDLEALFSGKKSSQILGPIISPGEIIFVPNIDILKIRDFSINVIGQVTRPGVHRLTEGKRLMDAIFEAGGFAQDASIEKLGIIHANRDDLAISWFSLKDYLRMGDAASNPVLNEGDTIIVPISKAAKSIPPLQTAFLSTISVSVIGEVAKPGTYQLSAEPNLLDVLVTAGGPTSRADLERTTIIRGEDAPLHEGEQRFSVNLKSVMTEGNLDPVPVMFSGDTVFMPRIKEKQESWWRVLMQVVRDVSTILVLYYLIVGRTYRS